MEMYTILRNIQSHVKKQDMSEIYANLHCVTFLRDGYTLQKCDAKVNTSHLTAIVIMSTWLVFLLQLSFQVTNTVFPYS
jgi:hypothetical protein